VRTRQTVAVVLLAILAALSVGEPAAWRAVGPVLAIAALMLTQPWWLKFDTLNVGVLLFVAYVCASWLWSSAPWVSFISAMSYVSAAIAFISLRHVVTSVGAMRSVAVGYLVGCVYLAVRLLSLSISVAGEPIGGRLNLPGINANYAGYALAGGFAVIVLLIATGPSSRLHYALYAAAAAAMIVGVSLSGARASLVSLVALVAWIGVTYFLRRPPVRALVTVVAIAFVLVVSGVVDKALVIFDDTADRSTGGLSGRLDLWPLAREHWLENFWVGTGTSSFQSANPYHAGAHNLILELGTGLGIVGVIGFIALAWLALKRGNTYLAGGFAAASSASYITGHWEAAPAAWVGLALFSISGISTIRVPTRRQVRLGNAEEAPIARSHPTM